MVEGSKKRSIRDLMRVSKEVRDILWLRESLQYAVELEHATLPPYLNAYWSIQNPTVPVANVIHGIFMQEMEHMGLAANMLVAVGGSPAINTPDFVPNYPGPLPGGVNPALTVYLSGLTKDAVENVYMEIEYPESGPVTLYQGAPYPTIGAFYDAIAEKFAELEDSDLTTEGQLDPSSMPAVTVISTVDDALAAIAKIQREGEGTATSPYEEQGGGQLAHYYSFGEIFHEKRLVPDGDDWSYTGEALNFPPCYPSGIVPPEGYPNAPDHVQALIQLFNETYSNMLDSLHSAWNGGGNSDLSTAIGHMMGLTEPARALMQIPIEEKADSQSYGPTWKYVNT